MGSPATVNPRTEPLRLTKLFGLQKRGKTKQGDTRIAIGVVRVSTSKQDIGVDAQRAELQRWCTANAVRLAAIHEDVGASGSLPLIERPGLLRAIEDAGKRGAGMILAVKRDRYARNRHTIADVERAATSVGARLVTCERTLADQTRDDESEELLTGLGDVLAQLELKRIRTRNKARARACIDAGRIHGGHVPFGYRRKEGGILGRSGKPVEIEPDPGEQQALERMRALRAEGWSCENVGKLLAKEGHRSREGTILAPGTVARLLQRVR
jgi:putative DNA-invertase from lambdoid prophage Rac